MSNQNIQGPHHHDIFSLFEIPTSLFVSFMQILNNPMEDEKDAESVFEKYFFRIFDEIYSLNDSDGSENTIEKFLNDHKN